MEQKLYVVAIANLFEHTNNAVLVAATSMKGAAIASVLSITSARRHAETRSWLEHGVADDASLDEIKEFFYDGEILFDAKLMTEDAFNSYVAFCRNATTN